MPCPMAGATAKTEHQSDTTIQPMAKAWGTYRASRSGRASLTNSARKTGPQPATKDKRIIQGLSKIRQVCS